MSMNDILRRWAVVLERKNDAVFTYDVLKQKKYISHLGTPRDLVERSYFQYKCQMQFNGVFMTVLLNIVSLPMLLVYLIKGLKTTTTPGERKNRRAVFFRDGKPSNIMPTILMSQYSEVETDPMEGFRLSKNDLKYIRQLRHRYPFSNHFILKCTIKIGRYRYAIEKHAPEAIIVCAEYSFTSSVLTDYCRRMHIKHIDVMHGEKVYYMQDSFFEFDECYVWNSYYADLFSRLGAEKNQFHVQVPPSLKFEKEYVKNIKYDYTYYLAAENEETLKMISLHLKKLNQLGKKISVRPHPRYSNIDLVRRLFKFANIENTFDTTIEQSLMQTGGAIALFSTVLNQALCNGIPVIIDDISNSQKYKKLEELEYICLKCEHTLLSQILEESN